jgi:hypothetical protein
VILLFYLIEKEVYLTSETWNLYFIINRSPKDPQNLSFILIACSWCENHRKNIVLLKTKNNPQNNLKITFNSTLKTTLESIFLDLIFQDYSSESLNLIFNLIFVILSESFNLIFSFIFVILNFNFFNKPLILIFNPFLLLLNYFLFLLESIIKKAWSYYKPRKSQNTVTGLL